MPSFPGCKETLWWPHRCSTPRGRACFKHTKTPSHLFTQLRHHPLPYDTGWEWRKARFLSQTTVGSASQAFFSLILCNPLAHSWWLVFHVGWPTLTCEWIFVLSPFNKSCSHFCTYMCLCLEFSSLPGKTVDWKFRYGAHSSTSVKFGEKFIGSCPRISSQGEHERANWQQLI